MELTDFDYTLPKEYISQSPTENRDQCRLMVLERKTGLIHHRLFFHLQQYLKKGDCLVVNNSKVLKSRIVGRKPSGGKIELLLLKKRTDLGGEPLFEALLKPARRVRKGEIILFNQNLKGEVIERGGDGPFILRFFGEGNILKNLCSIGRIPLPPYIRVEEEKEKRRLERCYQTIFARQKGSVALPAAGLHFTRPLLQRIKEKGVRIVSISLHVGVASFFHLKENTIEKNNLPPEVFSVGPKASYTINKAKERGGRIIAIGTSVARVLEDMGKRYGKMMVEDGETDLFIYPGFKFSMVDSLITNFHMPKTSLFLLVSALAGREKIIASYEEAKREGYRFLTFGDGMVIL